MDHLEGNLTLQPSQSCRHASPSTKGSVLGKRSVSAFAFAKLPSEVLGCTSLSFPSRPRSWRAMVSVRGRRVGRGGIYMKD
jgi:hypothetical protein